MTLSACSRRLSGHVRARALSVSGSGGQSLGLKSSNTLSHLDIPVQDTFSTSSSGSDHGLNALGFLSAATSISIGNLKQTHSSFAALGRAPPARVPGSDENDAASTFSRHPSAGPLRRPAALCLSTSMNVLASPCCTIARAAALTRAGDVYVPAGAASCGHSLVQTNDEQLLGLSNSQSDAGLLRRVPSPAQLSSPSVHPRILESNPQQEVYVSGPTEPVEAPFFPSSSVYSMSSSPIDASLRSPGPMPPPSVPSLHIPSSGTTQQVPTAPASPSPYPLTTPAVFGYSQIEHASPTLPRAPPTSPLYPPLSASSRTSAFVPESPIAHARRTPSPARTPPMQLRSTRGEHTLTVNLPEGLAPEMVTVCAKKGARLSVVADLWHRESDSHYEWEVAFAPADVDMVSVRAVFEADGELTIHVRRRSGSEGMPLPRIRTPSHD